ncbi:trypsin delta/gamma-like protein CG30031 [Trichogramma pretiosum]|uniref:trypsin delta/gamma-like protein CG30031 n=1 Tax=Trichogramma pretiosum TaxID=7493 RepID=UPI0006C9A94F|nr:trypsin delta/gamma-like protein CG30031 [Trichogramma pretiosum]
MYSIAVVALLLAATVAGDLVRESMINPFTPQGRIVGGKETTIEEHPWQVSIQSRGFHFCGGSLISNNIVLTAAHCTQSYPASSTNVRVGSSRTASGGSLHQVAEIIRHEAFRINLFGIPKNDIALLKLKTPVDLTKIARSVPLFNKSEEAVEGTPATISGWGTLTEGGKTPAVLQTVDVPIIDKDTCSAAYIMWGGVPRGQICAAYPAGGKDTCQGDSGGPLVINGRQAGVVSWGNGCARKGYPGVYTEVASYRDWISKHAKV